MKEIDDKLYTKYPDLLRQYKMSIRDTCLCWGILPCIGWHNLVGEMLTELEAYRKEKCSSLQLSQSKEKWGVLCVYFCGTKNAKQSREVSKIINKYIGISSKTCMYCGGRGTMRRRGWTRCACKECDAAREREYRVLTDT